MSATDPDDHVDILTEEIPAPPFGAPADFRQRLALYLKTTAPDTLAAAEAAYRGVWPSVGHYIARQLVGQLPPRLGWLLAICDQDQLRRGYEAGRLVLWAIPLGDGSAMVFESRRAPEPLPAPPPDGDRPPLEDPPCPQCGAVDWACFFHTDDPRHQPLGCDRCRPDLL